MSKLTLDEAIKHCLETAEQLEERANIPYKVEDSELQDNACRECVADHRQLAEWLRELKELREENKVLISECDRLIKEKGELLSKVSGGDVLRICQLEEQLEKAKRLLKAAIEALNDGSCIKDCRQCENYKSCDYDNRFKWQHTNEAMKLIGEDGDAGMTDSELQRLERCKKCSKSTEAEDFQGGTELYCPLHGYPCDMIIQCVYEGDTECQDTE